MEQIEIEKERPYFYLLSSIQPVMSQEVNAHIENMFRLDCLFRCAVPLVLLCNSEMETINFHEMFCDVHAAPVNQYEELLESDFQCMLINELAIEKMPDYFLKNDVDVSDLLNCYESVNLQLYLSYENQEEEGV